MSIDEWHSRSFLIELKPRAEFASLFVDCPPAEDSEQNAESSDNANVESAPSSLNEQQTTELVKIEAHGLELKDVENGNLDSAKSRFSVRIADLCLHPNTVCALTWADHRRLFMCKVHAEADGIPLGECRIPKTFHRLAKDISSKVPLEEYAENAQSCPIAIECAECSLKLLSYEPGNIEIGSIPEDDWLETAPSMEYFCRDSCAHSHSNSSDPSDLTNASNRDRWLPTNKRFILAHSFIFVLRQTLPSDVMRICESSGIVKCIQCAAELGIVYRRNSNLVQLHHAVTTLKASKSIKPYIDVRFGCIERYFAWLLLSQCESQTSLKLVIRSYDKRPYLLIWLLESYVVLTSGDLRENSSSSLNGTEPSSNGNSHNADEESTSVENDCVHSFPALKMLYKVFDSESARSDPRANGEDASVGLVDVPLGCCLRLIQLLLSSSHALPPACRSVGQFYVGFVLI
ncbi:unnamed protein product [Anisakis simplex]|uniref:E3 ubiquitin-protein ligase E3D n=1 Tax=Anisakis simplex TaxID=6269 RepID=A0A0M3JYZ6_ANISI|nr:unnamed protein product [Anisakis simplex]